MENAKLKTIQDAVNYWKQIADQTAIRFVTGDKMVSKSYKELSYDVRKISAWLFERGYSKKHIALIGENSYEWICIWFAIANIGAVSVTINKDLNEEELLDHIQFADCVLTIYGKDVEDKMQQCKLNSEKDAFLSYKELLDQNVSNMSEIEAKYEGLVKPDDIATILYTSGTTGRSKAVMLSHGNLLNNYFYDYKQEDYKLFNEYLIMPFHHIISLGSIVMVLAEGGTLNISSSVKYFIRDLNIMKPSELMMVPQMIRVLCEYIEKVGVPSFVPYIKRIFSGGVTLNLDDWNMLKKNQIEVIQAYGLTETAGVGLSCTMCEGQSDRLGKTYNHNIDVFIKDGEIVLKGHSVMKGYYKNPEETALALEGDLFHTGDLGYIDEDGYVYITGRKKNLIILSNGENINPEEIERVLILCKEIQEVMVIEVENKLCAEIFPTAAADEEAQKKNIEAFIRQYNIEVPTYRQIRKVIYRSEEFEKTSTNKIKRILKKA